MRVDMGPHYVSVALREWTLSGAFCPTMGAGAAAVQWAAYGPRMESLAQSLAHDLWGWHGGSIGREADRL